MKTMDEYADRLVFFADTYKQHLSVLDLYKFISAVDAMKAMYEVKCREVENLLIELLSKRTVQNDRPPEHAKDESDTLANAPNDKSDALAEHCFD